VRPTYALAALALGLIGFLAIEVTGDAMGVRTAMGPSIWLDGAAYMLATLLLAALFARPFGRARGWLVLPTLLAFLLLYAPVTAVIAGVLDLTTAGGWGVSSLVRGALIATPVNLIVTFTVDLWFVALPLGVASVVVLWRLARRGAGLRF